MSEPVILEPVTDPEAKRSARLAELDNEERGVLATQSPGHGRDMALWLVAAKRAALLGEPAPAVPVPQVITDRQFGQRLRDLEIITQAEALAFVGQGTVPAVLAALIAALPEAARDDAMLSVVGAVEYRRNHPFTTAIGTAFGWSSEQVDDFFRAAALL
jgi:hypothetical protein